VPTGIGGCWPAIQTPVSPQFADVSYFAQTPGDKGVTSILINRQSRRMGCLNDDNFGEMRTVNNIP
jgi:hypothetical protein